MRLGVLRQREFRLVFLAEGVSALGDRMVAVALAFAVLGLGGTASAVGLVLACRMLAMIASLLAGGVVADRVSRRGVMVVADLVRLGSQGLMGVLLIAGAAHVWTLALLAGITGAATGFFNPASTGLLVAVVAQADLQEANGLRSTGTAAGEIAGPAIAGVLVAGVGPGWAIAVDAATFAASAALLGALRLPPAVARSVGTSFVADLRDGWAAFRSRTWVWAVVAVLAVDGMLWSAWSALGPVVAKQRLGGAAAWGTVLAVFGLGALLGGLAAMRARPSRPLLVFALSGVAIAVPLGCLAAAAPLPVLAAGALLAGAAIMVANSVWESTLQRHIPAESLSRVSAYDWFGSMALGPLGLIMWGPIAAAAGLGPALWIAFGVHLATAALLAAIPDIRRLPASPPPPASPSPAADLQPRMPPAGQSADTTTAAESPCPPRAGERGNPSGREDAAAGRIAGTEPA